MRQEDQVGPISVGESQVGSEVVFTVMRPEPDRDGWRCAAYLDLRVGAFDEENRVGVRRQGVEVDGVGV